MTAVLFAFFLVVLPVGAVFVSTLLPKQVQR